MCMTTEQPETIVCGAISLEMISSLGLNLIQVRLFPVKEIYQCYLDYEFLNLMG